MYFTVHLMTPCCTWTRVEANSKEEAIQNCKQEIPEELDPNDPTHFVAMEEE
jgi:hypothetical protein